MEPFVWKHKEGSPGLFKLQPWCDAYTNISAGFTSRIGGVSNKPYESLNLAFHVGDDPNDVIMNRKKLAETIGFDWNAWTSGEQVHGTEIAVVKEEDSGRGRDNRESAFQHTDGLVTNVPGVLLTSFYADCVPLFFYDPVKSVVGLAHAGWKGTVGKIALRMVNTMEKEYGSSPQDIVAAIGPSIGECCYEVDEVVMSRVRELLDEFPADEKDIPAFYQPVAGGKSMLNLKQLNRHIMIKGGILPTHIECTTWCTNCHPDYFFSYRKEGGTTGRMASWIGIEKR
ncbi:peptidoglycan editing factor PgeF [Paenibacillus sediminis]|uniref:Purine nucleoside phosphorylase n=1 Tax=Paenibacillus sediminis TaxID=664909 RepID=A0ABS4GYW0_9BACL|nr:peptidoglycan editing factor PgeF [Paenibacillus sediminis]MBP1935465.1 YfiH family protein [Paenibacillus sediminis]